VIEFIQRLFGKPASSATAKERLRLVLLSDHLSLAPDVVEALKHDLVEVISRYVEVDEENCDVTFEQREKQIAMLANIPILGMRSRPKPPTAPPPAAPPPPPAREPEITPSLDLGGATASVALEPKPLAAEVEPVTAAAEPMPSAAVDAKANGTSTNGNGTARKRRRKRPSGTAVPSPG
jgi:cell division topological specificity factor